MGSSDERCNFPVLICRTERNWEEVTPRIVAQFKTHLLRTDPEDGLRVLADATVSRSLGTLKNFYGWMLYLDQSFMSPQPKTSNQMKWR